MRSSDSSFDPISNNLKDDDWLLIETEDKKTEVDSDSSVKNNLTNVPVIKPSTTAPNIINRYFPEITPKPNENKKKPTIPQKKTKLKSTLWWQLECEVIEYQSTNVALLYKNQVIKGTLYLTNYQIYFSKKDQQPKQLETFEKLLKREYSIPNSQILSLEEKWPQEISSIPENFDVSGYLRITRKDYTILELMFFKENLSSIVLKKMKNSTAIKDIQKVFAYKFRQNSNLFTEKEIEEGWKIYDVYEEYTKRQNISKVFWKVTDLNDNFKICSSYPKKLVVPAFADSKLLYGSANFRSQGRIPVLSWVHPQNKASLTRSSQPCPGISRCRSNEDENLVNSLVYEQSKYRQELKTNEFYKERIIPKIFIIDCRPKTNAVANTLMGKGYENTDNYNNCEIQFMGIENIHAMSDSFQKLSKSWCKITDTNYISMVEAIGWIKHISTVLQSANYCVSLLQNGNSVLTHCSDGWDRTAQLSALTQLLIDPFYRTIKGFAILIEKEWISFGHRFQDRNGYLQKGDDQMSPIFLQFIDCVHHVFLQFPDEFEFNQDFLLFIVEQSYSGVFGNFLYNNEKDSIQNEKKKKTISIWTFVFKNLNLFTNSFFKNRKLKVIECNVSLNKLSTEVWSIFFLYPGMRSPYQEMISQMLKNLEVENKDMKDKLSKEVMKRKSLENELSSIRATISDYRNIMPSDPITSLELSDNDTVLLTNVKKRSTSIKTISTPRLTGKIGNAVIVEDYFKI
eukprot:gene12212-5799_t